MLRYVLFIPFIVQALCIFYDEFYFHLKRGLPKWERLGHPLDSLSVLVCFLFVLIFPYNVLNLKIFIALSLFSTLFITKDEFVHVDHCPKVEMWLHALLFINHPIMMAALGFLWALSFQALPFSWLEPLLNQKEMIVSFIKLQTLFISVFMSYQIIYWNFLWKPKTAK
jgi:hypothetical protein